MSSIAASPALHFPASTTRARTGSAAAISPFEWLLVILGGLPLCLPVLIYLGEAGLGSTDPIRWYFWASALISSPHIYGTYVRLQRKMNERRVSWLLGFPCYFGIVGVLAVVAHFGKFVEAVTLVNVWQSFHYVRQSYGVGCLYGRQSVFTETDRWVRWCAYHLTFPALVIGRWDTLYDAWNGKTYSFMPMDFSHMMMAILWGVAAVGILVGVAGELWLAKKNGASYRSTGLICFLVCVGVHAYGFCVLSHFQRGFFAVTIFHAVQYLALVWFMERRQGQTTERAWAVRLPNLVGFAAFWALLFALGYSYEQHFSMYLVSYWPHAASVLLAAISAHHYIVDTFIWRRKVGA